jgi:hypothetical protein
VTCFGPLSSAPISSTVRRKVDKVVPRGPTQQNPGVRNTCRFLDWIRATSSIIARRCSWPALLKGNFDERGLPARFSWIFAKAFDIAGVQGSPLQANHFKLAVSPGENHIFISSLPNVLNVLPLSRINMLWHAGWCGPGWNRLPCALQCMCRRHTCTLPPRRAGTVRGRHGYRSPSFLVRYLEVYLGRLEHWLRDCRISILVSKSNAVFFIETARRIQEISPVHFLGEPVQWDETARYLGVTLDTRLTR